MTAREERPNLGDVREAELVFTDRDQAEFARLYTADTQQYPHRDLPPNWQVGADAEPESPRPPLAVLILLNTAAILVLLVVGRIVWQGISTVVGL